MDCKHTIRRVKMIIKYCKCSLVLIFCGVTLLGCGSAEDTNTKTVQTPVVADKKLVDLFADNNLQSCVDAVAASQQWESSAQVTGALDCSNKNIVSLMGLEFLINLTELNLSYNQITDVHQISKLTNLKVVRLQNNNIGSNGEGNVDKLTALSGAIDINVAGNISVSCTELKTLTKKLNGNGNPSILEGALATSEIVNPEPFNKVNCTKL